MNAPLSGEKRIRFAIYTRYSSEMQNELSLEAQEHRCRKSIAERGGTVVAVYSDGAKSGWSLERDGFNQMRSDAEHDRFDAVMFWKFDRLARDHNHTVMIKMLLRHEYGLKLYCVEGYSEDEDDSPYSALMEQMLAVFAAFYSKNLSSETKRGKRQRAMNGEFNGSVPPLGYDLVTLADSTPDRPAGLHVNLRQAAVVRRAFRLYATGDYSDADVAQYMNEQPVMQHARAGRQPINREMIRDLLQNNVYTGRVPHCDTVYKGTLGQGRKSSRGRKEWFEGKHRAIIDDDLYATCQAVRAGMASHRIKPTTIRTYLLHDRVYCARCIVRKPVGLVDDNYGRMRPYFHKQRRLGYYRCMSERRGYEKCEQCAAHLDRIDGQLIALLSQLEIPDGLRERVESAVRERVENAASLERMAEVQAIVERIDFSWEQGFIGKEEYLEKRRQLQQEINSLRPLDYDQLIEAADLLTNFCAYWKACDDVDRPDEARHQLVSKIVDRVYVHDNQIAGVVLHGDFAIVLGENATAPELDSGAAEREAISQLLATLLRSQFGSDGFLTFLRHLIIATCVYVAHYNTIVFRRQEILMPYARHFRTAFRIYPRIV